MSISTAGFITFIRWLGWRGLLCLVLLGMLVMANRARDQVQRQVDALQAKVDVAATDLRASAAALGQSRAALNRAAGDIRLAVQAGRDWSSTVGTVNGLLTECQAENVRLGEDARQARARAAAITTAAERGISAAGKRFNSATPHCIASLKQMEAACSGQL